MTPTVERALIVYGENNGYDGLVNTPLECGCDWQDLAPCGHLGIGCQMAYRHSDGLMYTKRGVNHDTK